MSKSQIYAKCAGFDLNHYGPATTDVTWTEAVLVQTELFGNCGVPVIYSNSPQKKFSVTGLRTVSSIKAL